jgi:hypothetical protein
VFSLASSLSDFGLLELSGIAAHANQRARFLDYFDQLIGDQATLESHCHSALENNLWTLGRKYSLMSSNVTLRNIIESYCSTNFKGPRANKRPDLLLSQDNTDSYLLIEFKRPSHPITRDDIAQAEKYRDDLANKLSSSGVIEILMVGKGKSPSIDVRNMAGDIKIQSYASLVSAARHEISWIIKELSKEG